MQAQALDSKNLRGATTCGTATHLISRVQHSSGVTLAQLAVGAKHNELSAAPASLHKRELTDTITTSDALHTQRAFAHYLHTARGYHLMMVKRNQPQLYEDMALFFMFPAIAADYELWGRVETVNKGHSWLETRALECRTADCAYLKWPGATHIVRRTCIRLVERTGKKTNIMTYGVTKLPP